MRVNWREKMLTQQMFRLDLDGSIQYAYTHPMAWTTRGICHTHSVTWSISQSIKLVEWDMQRTCWKYYKHEWKAKTFRGCCFFFFITGMAFCSLSPTIAFIHLAIFTDFGISSITRRTWIISELYYWRFVVCWITSHCKIVSIIRLLRLRIVMRKWSS